MVAVCCDHEGERTFTVLRLCSTSSAMRIRIVDWSEPEPDSVL